MPSCATSYFCEDRATYRSRSYVTLQCLRQHVYLVQGDEDNIWPDDKGHSLMLTSKARCDHYRHQCLSALWDTYESVSIGEQEV